MFVSIAFVDIATRHEEEHDLPATSYASNGDSLLRSIVEGAKAAAGAFSPCTAEDFIVDNCKNIYFAGHETTSTTAAWCLMLLAAHPEWQSRARRGPGGSPPSGTKASGRGHAPEAEDGDDGGAGDAPAVPTGAGTATGVP